MKLIMIIFALWFFTVTTWALYLAVMALKRDQAQLTVVAKTFAYPLLFVGYLFDIAYNVIVGTLMFLELPREFLLTDRLKRHLSSGRSHWRWAIANWFCQNFLNAFDPSGRHC